MEPALRFELSADRGVMKTEAGPRDGPDLKRTNLSTHQESCQSIPDTVGSGSRLRHWEQ